LPEVIQSSLPHVARALHDDDEAAAGNEPASRGVATRAARAAAADPSASAAASIAPPAPPAPPPRPLELSDEARRQMRAEDFCVNTCQWAAERLGAFLARERGGGGASLAAWAPRAPLDVRQGWLDDLARAAGRIVPARSTVVVVGDTGAGKSSVLNALLDETALLPTNGMRACTGAARAGARARQCAARAPSSCGRAVRPAAPQSCGAYCCASFPFLAACWGHLECARARWASGGARQRS
jgi:hypothetical protein